MAGTYGDLPRNALRGPIFRQVDLILAKRFNITETVNLQFRTEVFNIFNWNNNLSYGGTQFTAAGAPVASFGVPTGAYSLGFSFDYQQFIEALCELAKVCIT